MSHSNGSSSNTKSQTVRLPYGDTVIEYSYRYTQRKTLGITVHPDLRVTVAIPHGVSLGDAQAVVLRRAPWILRQQRELEQYLPNVPPRRYVGGETHRYLGRQYRLKLKEADDGREWVKMSGGYLLVRTRAKDDAARVQQLVDGWYRRQAERVFAERLAAILPRFAPWSIPTPTVRIRRMKSRWGSCSTSGNITLNLKLMQVPKSEIDYVIVHELCHLVEYNHSKRFYQLLDRMLPDWQARRQKLNAYEVS